MKEYHGQLEWDDHGLVACAVCLSRGLPRPGRMEKTKGFPGNLTVQDETPATWYPLHSACWRDEQDWDTLSRKTGRQPGKIGTIGWLGWW